MARSPLADSDPPPPPPSLPPPTRRVGNDDLSLVADHDKDADSLVVSIAGKLTSTMRPCPHDAGILLGWTPKGDWASVRVENVSTIRAKDWICHECQREMPGALFLAIHRWLLEQES